MTREEEDEKEFEKLWLSLEFTGIPGGYYGRVKKYAKDFWLEGRRTLRESIKVAIQQLGEDEDIDPRTAERIWDMINETLREKSPTTVTTYGAYEDPI